MAPNLKETPQQRSKRNWFLACFGIPRKTTSTSDKKSKKSRDRKRLFKLCMPKIKVIIIRRRKGSYDAKTVTLKACQSMITLEATKFHQRKINHASITQEPIDQQKVSDDALDLQRPIMDQLDATSCQKKEPIPTDDKCIDNKLTKDSLIGVSIVVVTLIIMSIWGRLCAILCMSAWLYCASLLRVHMGGKPNLASFKIDMASKLYKKKMLKAS